MIEAWTAAVDCKVHLELAVCWRVQTLKGLSFTIATALEM